MFCNERLLLAKMCGKPKSVTKVAKKKIQFFFPGIILFSHSINKLSQVFAKSFMLLQHRN